MAKGSAWPWVLAGVGVVGGLVWYFWPAGKSSSGLKSPSEAVDDVLESIPSAGDPAADVGTQLEAAWDQWAEQLGEFGGLGDVWDYWTGGG